jgi:hypothetical protein
MTTIPHDLPDLYLAPLTLAIDERIDELARLDIKELSMRVALDSDKPDWTQPMRESGLLLAVRRLIDCHGWSLTWDPRGVRLSHRTHSVVLGVPATFQQYVSG